MQPFVCVSNRLKTDRASARFIYVYVRTFEHDFARNSQLRPRAFYTFQSAATNRYNYYIIYYVKYFTPLACAAIAVSFNINFQIFFFSLSSLKHYKRIRRRRSLSFYCRLRNTSTHFASRISAAAEDAGARNFTPEQPAGHVRRVKKKKRIKLQTKFTTVVKTSPGSETCKFIGAPRELA